MMYADVVAYAPAARARAAMPMRDMYIDDADDEAALITRRLLPRACAAADAIFS